MSDSAVQFGRLPYKYLIKAGGLARLRGGTQCLVYMAVAAHAQDPTFRSFPSVPTIAAILGVSERTVQRALRGLVAGGHIKVVVGGGRGRSSVYELTTKGDIQGVTVSANDDAAHKTAKGDAQGVTVSGGERVTNRGTKGDIQTPKRVTNRGTKGDIQGVTPREQEIEEMKQPQEPAAAAGVLSAETDPIRQSLVAAGIGEPVRGRLVAALAASAMTSTQAAEMVRNKAAACKAAGKRGGVLIAEIEASIEQAQAQAQRREEARVSAAADAARRWEQDALERKAVTSQAVEREAFISGLTPEDYGRLKGEALKESPHMRALWEQTKESRGLHVSMYGIHKRQRQAAGVTA